MKDSIKGRVDEKCSWTLLKMDVNVIYFGLYKLEEHLKQISFKIIEALYETNTNMIAVEVPSN